MRAKLPQILILLVLLLGVPVSVYLVGRVTGFFGRASGTPANLIIDLSASYSRSPLVWQNLAQGGEEDGRMLASVIAKVKPLRPKYIRIDHIFDYYGTAKKENGKVVLDFTKLDQTISDIGAMGAKPMLSFSYMPPSFTKSGSTTDNPDNWGDWEYLVQSTIEHVSGSKGLNLTNVYYEVWNEPDLFGKYKTYGSKNYLDLYAHSASGAARASGVNPFKFGGPATTSLYENWLTSLLKYVSDNNLRMDFFSWHRYSKNLDDYEKDAANYKTWSAPFPIAANLETAVTEIGPNGDVDKVYDTGFAAIHTIATSAVLEDKIDKTFIFEIKDGVGSSQYWGRWGIFTNDKFGDPIAKPRFSAITFLNNMIGNRINVAGQGSWVKAFAKNDGKTTRTLVVNYDPNGSHTEGVPITFVNIPQSSPSAALRTFQFRRLDYGGGISQSLTMATDSASWATLQNMNPNTAAIFELTPQ